jgi:hypothetical protein
MKKVLCLLISFFFINASFAYETVLVDFPQAQGWHAVYYNQSNGESILQYVPKGQSDKNWNRTLIFHSYKRLNWTNNAARFMDRMTSLMEAKNSFQLYKYTKYDDKDSIAVRCIEKNALIPTQCEIYRVSRSHEGLISMHYINKNVQDYIKTYKLWHQILKNVRIYNNYYRTDRILDKADSFEL